MFAKLPGDAPAAPAEIHAAARIENEAFRIDNAPALRRK